MELSELEKEKEINNKQRLEWVKYWVDYMKQTPNKVWSKQQADFINSVMRSADVDTDIYLKIKNLTQKKSQM